MHIYTLHHFYRECFEKKIHACRILQEKSTPLSNGRKGAYDFLIENADGKLTGVEVLTRPSKGKLKEKLPYKDHADEFIFVLPAHGMNFYKKPDTKKFRKVARDKFFPKEFSEKKIKVLLLDMEKGTFSKKKAFSEVFNVR